MELQKVPGYKPPAYNTLRTTLLDECKERVTDKLQLWEGRVPVTGVTICSDGWSDAASRPLLNVLAVNPKGAKFVTAIDTSGKQKTAAYIASCIFETIDAIGAENVVQVSKGSTGFCELVVLSEELQD